MLWLRAQSRWRQVGVIVAVGVLVALLVVRALLLVDGSAPPA